MPSALDNRRVMLLNLIDACTDLHECPAREELKQELQREWNEHGMRLMGGPNERPPTRYYRWDNIIAELRATKERLRSADLSFADKGV